MSSTSRSKKPKAPAKAPTSNGGAQLLPEQQLAIDTRDVSVALSAGAGCGKTFVLTQRFLSHVEPGAQAAGLPQLVAITFTERAAREMRERIRGEVRRRLHSAAPEQTQHWLQLLRTLHTARISTIHSFCGALLRSNAAEAQLDPAFRQLDEVEANNLLLSAIEDLIQRELANRHPGLMRLAVDCSLGRLRGMLNRMVRGRQQPWLDAWREKSPDDVLACWSEVHLQHIVPRLRARIAESECVRALLRVLREHVPTHKTMQARREALLEQFEKLPTTESLAEQLAAIREHSAVQGGGGAKAWESAEIYALVRDNCADLRTLIDKCLPLLEWDADAARLAASAGLDLLELAIEARDEYARRKLAASALDFDDLLLRARDLLCGEAGKRLRAQYAGHTHLLMVDEFQDTDEVQVDLIRALCDDDLESGKVFLVGDMKQSIYRFRGAQPQVFRELREKIPKRGQLPLSRNFRSQPAILHFVNALFSQEIANYEPLSAHRSQMTTTPAVEFLWSPVETGEKVDAIRRREADWIARRLRQLIDSGAPIVTRKGSAGEFETKPVEPADIAILFRALSNVQYYEEALRRYDIDYYLVGGHAFYAQQEVFDLVNLLRAVASPGDEVSLAGALRSPFFSVSDEGIFWLAQHRDGLSGGLFDTSAPAQVSNELRARIDFARETLLQLRSMKDRLLVAELINLALSRTGYDAILLADFLGERKLANLRKLVEMARSFDRTGLFTLHDFIAQLSEFVAKQPDEALAATQAEKTRVVRLMTIHQAKGLEFPLVVVPDLDRRSQHSSYERVAFDRKLGPLVRLNEDAPGAEALCGYDLYQELERDEEEAEITRLLYVATTRAADYLILSAGIKQGAKLNSPWTKLLARRFDLESGEPVDGEFAPDEKPKVLVTRQEPPSPSGKSERSTSATLARIVEQVEIARPSPIELHIDPLPARGQSRRRYSFSQISGELHPIADYEAYGPADESADDDQSQRVADPVRLGTIVHAVLSEIDRAEPIDVAARVHHHADIEFRDDPQSLSDASELIEKFLKSPRAESIRSAAEIHTEIEFLLTWPPGDDGPDAAYLHGFIDCLYRDSADAWHIVDYKTNRVTARQADAAAAQYEMQMLLYGLAAENILGETPRELVLHFLRSGAERGWSLDGEGRQRVTEFLNRQIAALRAGEPALA